MFEPDIYNEISKSKALLTGFSSSGNKRSDNPTQKLISNILNETDNSKKPFIEKFFKELFPNIGWTLGGNYYSDGYIGRWQRELRICHSSNFDKYFQFCVPSGELSNSDLREMLAMTSNSTALSEYILSLRDKGILKTAISQFEPFADEVPLDNGYEFIKSLIDVCDKIDHDHLGFFSLSSNSYVGLMTSQFLKRIPDVKERGKLLISCFKNGEGISTVDSILQYEENCRTDSDVDVLLADPEFAELKAEFVARLDYLSENKSDELLSHDHLLSFLYRWKRWGDESKIVNWLLMQTYNTGSCIKLLKAFIRTSSMQGMEDYMPTISYGINLKTIEEFIPIDSIVETINRIDRSSLDDDSKYTIGLFEKSIANRNGLVQ